MLAQEYSVGIRLPALIFILLAVLAVFYGSRRALRKRPGGSASARYRGLWLALRLACATVGVGLLVVVGLGTRHAARAIYDDLDRVSGLLVRLPTEPTAATTPETDLNQVDAQYLVHLVVAEVNVAGTRPLAVKEFRIRWPADKNKLFRGRLAAAGSSIETKFTVGEVRRNEAGDFGAAGRINLRGTLDEEIAGLAGHGHMHDGGGLGSSGRRVGIEPVFRKPILSTGSERLAAVRAFYLVTQAQSTDALVSAPVEELLRQHAAEIDDLRERTISARLTPDETAMALSGGARLFYSIGFTTGLLAAAVALLVFAFPVRSVAAMAATLAVVLYVVLLDRAVLGYHMHRLNDTTATAEERLLACAQATDTFFFRETALKRVEAVAKDRNAPPELVSLAERVRSSLR
jgi:hypothetical protein